MLSPLRADLHARALARVRLDVRRAAPQPDPQEQYLDRLAAAGVPDVAALMAQYRAGSITLAQAVTQARQAASDYYADALDEAEPGERTSHHVLSAGLLFGALGGLAMLGHGQAESVGKAASTVSVGAAAGEFGVTVTKGERAAAAKTIQERLAAIRQNVADGTITEAQGAAQAASAVDSFVWQQYQGSRRDAATAAGKATETFILDPDAQHCDPCVTRAEGSPYPIGTNPPPASGDMDCTYYDKCDVEYGDAEDEEEDTE